MGTTRITFFALPSEIISGLNCLSDDLGICFAKTSRRKDSEGLIIAKQNTILEKDVGTRVRVFNQSDLDAIGEFATSRQVFKSAVLDLPRLENNTLYLGEIAAKSDWYDSDSRSYEDIREGVKLVQALRRRLNKHGVWGDCVVSARRTGSTGPGRVYNDIKCTPGAQKFFIRGGHLRQEDAKYVEFLVSNS